MKDVKSNSWKLESISMGDLLRLEMAPREFIISPWLRQGESVMVYAPPGVGKSMYSLALGLAVASGGKLIDTWEAPTPRKVLYVDGEMHLDDIRERINLLKTAAGGDVKAMESNLHFITRHHQPDQKKGQTVDFVDLSKPESRDALIGFVKKEKFELVILDNLSTLAEIEDENAAGAFNDAVNFLLQLKQNNIACLLVHHANKTRGSYRGSSKIATTFEVIQKLEESPNPKAAFDPDITAFKLSWEKHRHKRDESTISDLDIELSIRFPPSRMNSMILFSFITADIDKGIFTP